MTGFLPIPEKDFVAKITGRPDGTVFLSASNEMFLNPDPLYFSQELLAIGQQTLNTHFVPGIQNRWNT